MTAKFVHYLISALVTVAAVICCLAAPQQHKQSKDEPELMALVRQMTEAQTKFDAATLAKIYTSDFIEISPVGEVDPREKTIGFYKPEAKPPGDLNVSVTVDEFLIRTYGNIAVVIARVNYASVTPSPRPPFSVRATFVCRKEKGVWRIGSSQYTAIRPPRPTQ